MKRSTFIKQLSSLAGITLISPATRLIEQKRETAIYSGLIKGASYYKAEEIQQNLKESDPLDLKREPGNKHDKKAIEVYWCGYKLGYIARDDNKVISNMMDEGIEFSARLKKHYEDRSLYRALVIEVSLLC